MEHITVGLSQMTDKNNVATYKFTISSLRVIRCAARVKSVGIEMQLRNQISQCLLVPLSSLFLTTIIAAPPAQAQAPSRVGEAVVVQREVLRVSTEATSQVSVGDGLLRDE